MIMASLKSLKKYSLKYKRNYNYTSHMNYRIFNVFYIGFITCAAYIAFLLQLTLAVNQNFIKRNLN